MLASAAHILKIHQPELGLLGPVCLTCLTALFQCLELEQSLLLLNRLFPPASITLPLCLDSFHSGFSLNIIFLIPQDTSTRGQHGSSCKTHCPASLRSVVSPGMWVMAGAVRDLFRIIKPGVDTPCPPVEWIKGISCSILGIELLWIHSAFWK